MTGLYSLKGAFSVFQEAENLVAAVIPKHLASAAPEVAVYLKEAVGNSTRIDYGTGTWVTAGLPWVAPLWSLALRVFKCVLATRYSASLLQTPSSSPLRSSWARTKGPGRELGLGAGLQEQP